MLERFRPRPRLYSPRDAGCLEQGGGLLGSEPPSPAAPTLAPVLSPQVLSLPLPPGTGLSLLSSATPLPGKPAMGPPARRRSHVLLLLAVALASCPGKPTGPHAPGPHILAAVVS